MRKIYNGENNTGHYNFIIIDREIIIVTDEKNRNQPSPLKLSLEAIGLYVVIKAHAIDKNFAWPSLATLEEITGKKRDTILKYIDELKIKGLIIIEKKKNPRGGRECNVYVIPGIDKEYIKNQGPKFGPCSAQSPKNGSCKVQKSDLAKSKIWTGSNNNRNIITELILKANFDIIPAGAAAARDLLADALSDDPESLMDLQGDNLKVKYKYPDVIKRLINSLLGELDLYEKISVEVIS